MWRTALSINKYLHIDNPIETGCRKASVYSDPHMPMSILIYAATQPVHNSQDPAVNRMINNVVKSHQLQYLTYSYFYE